MKNAYEHREGDILIKLRARKARICYICRSYSHELDYCRQYKKYIIEAKEALTCEGYECIFNASKVKCSDCRNLSYGYYCEALKGSAPYLKREKECSAFIPKK